MKVPKIYLQYKMPYEKQDFLDKYWSRRDWNLRERWITRNIVRLFRDIKLPGKPFGFGGVVSSKELREKFEDVKNYMNHVKVMKEDEAFKAVFG